MRSQLTPKAIRRLISADGYIALSMPHKAIAELEKTEDMGPLEGPRQLLMGLAKKLDGQHSDAIPHLEQAARTMPSSARRFAWSELVGCYQAVGAESLAEVAQQLGGDSEFELRIALPFGDLNIVSTFAEVEFNLA